MTTTSPTDVGFHCPGTCWNEAGGTAGLFAWLEAQGPDFRDWFVQAQWTEEDPASLRLPPVSSIHPIQDYLVSEAVERYRASQASIEGEREAWEAYPTLFTWQGLTYVFQGTHRLAAAYLNGQATYLGWHVDLDLP